MTEKTLPEFHQVEPRLSLAHFPPVKARIETAANAIGFVCRNLLNQSYHERLIGIYCDSQHHPLCYSVLSEGTETSADAGIQTILTPAILYGVSRIILIHNHPSGNGRPSDNDYRFSYNAYHRCQDFGIYLIDSIVMPCGQDPDNIKFTSISYEERPENPWYQERQRIKIRREQQKQLRQQLAVADNKL